MAKQRTYSQYAQEAAVLMGEQVKLGRKRRRWSGKNLAERAGISLVTLRRIEGGDMGCAVGLVFEVAALVGVSLFESDPTTPLAKHIEHTRDKVALLPKRIRAKTKAVYDDF